MVNGILMSHTCSMNGAIFFGCVFFFVFVFASFFFCLLQLSTTEHTHMPNMKKEKRERGRNASNTKWFIRLHDKCRLNLFRVNICSMAIYIYSYILSRCPWIYMNNFYVHDITSQHIIHLCNNKK